MALVAYDAFKRVREVGVVRCFHVALATLHFAAGDVTKCELAVVAVLATHALTATYVADIAIGYFLFGLRFVVGTAAKFGATIRVSFFRKRVHLVLRHSFVIFKVVVDYSVVFIEEHCDCAYFVISHMFYCHWGGV